MQQPGPAAADHPSSTRLPLLSDLSAAQLQTIRDVCSEMRGPEAASLAASPSGAANLHGSSLHAPIGGPAADAAAAGSRRASRNLSSRRSRVLSELQQKLDSLRATVAELEAHNVVLTEHQQALVTYMEGYGVCQQAGVPPEGGWPGGAAATSTAASEPPPTQAPREGVQADGPCRALLVASTAAAQADPNLAAWAAATDLAECRARWRRDMQDLGMALWALPCARPRLGPSADLERLLLGCMRWMFAVFLMQPDLRWQLVASNLDTGEQESAPPDHYRQLVDCLALSTAQQAQLSAIFGVHDRQIAPLVAQREALIRQLQTQGGSVVDVEALLAARRGPGHGPQDAAMAAAKAAVQQAELAASAPARRDPDEAAGLGEGADPGSAWAGALPPLPVEPEAAAARLEEVMAQFTHLCNVNGLSIMSALEPRQLAQYLVASWPFLPSNTAVGRIVSDAWRQRQAEAMRQGLAALELERLAAEAALEEEEGG